MCYIRIIGNVGKFIADKTTKGGKPFKSFTIAERSVNKETGEIFTTWHSVKCSHMGLLEYFQKNTLQVGDYVKVEGYLSYFKSYDGSIKPAIWIYGYQVLKKKTVVKAGKAKSRKAA